MFWEAEAHALAGRVEVARELFQSMLELGGMGSRKAHLTREARKWLDLYST